MTRLDVEEEMQYDLTSYDGVEVVKIWRTPLFKDWYDEEYIDLGGTISGIPHFESACITYSGVIDEITNEPFFTSSNDSCELVVDGINGFRIDESGNARNQDEDLILSFKGAISIDPAYYNMQNTHMMAVAPNGRFNVTDSYMQVQSMFVPPAEACEINDLECRSESK